MTETYNLISVKKLDDSESWIFSYDDPDLMIQTLIDMGHDTDSNLNWAEIDKLIETINNLELSDPLPPTLLDD